MNTTNPEMMTDNQLRTECERLMEENTKLKNRWQPPLGATNFGDLIAEKDEEIKKLKNEISQSMKILREANCEILGDIKDGVTKDQLKKDLKTFKDAVVEALGGPKFNQPYEDCIRLRDITCEIAGLKKQIDELISYRDQLLLKETKTHNENVALKSEIEKLEHHNYTLRQNSKGYGAEEVEEYRQETEQLLKELEELKKENNKLKEDNDYLREEDAGWCAVKKLKKELEEIKEVKKIVTEVATQTETDGLQEEIDKLKQQNEDGCKLIKALMDKLHPLTARVLGVAQYIVDNEKDPFRIEIDTLCDLLGFTREFLRDVKENCGKVAKDLSAVKEDEIKEEEEEIDIVRDFGDQSIQAKRAGIGVFKKDCVEEEKVYSVSEMKKKIEKDTGLKLDNSFAVVDE